MVLDLAGVAGHRAGVRLHRARSASARPAYAGQHRAESDLTLMGRSPGAVSVYGVLAGLTLALLTTVLLNLGPFAEQAMVLP